MIDWWIIPLIVTVVGCSITALIAAGDSAQPFRALLAVPVGIVAFLVSVTTWIICYAIKAFS